MTGEFIHARHNGVRNLFAELAAEVAYDVEVEPRLQPLHNERFRLRTTTTDDEARLDIAVSGLWGNRFERTFVDVRVFNPTSRTVSDVPAEAYRAQEQHKRRVYEQRVTDVEHGTFVPLIFRSTGGASPAAHAFIKRVCQLLQHKKNIQYSEAMANVRTRLSFALQRSALVCLRGSRRVKRKLKDTTESILAVNAEAGIKK